MYNATLLHIHAISVAVEKQ